MAGGVQQAGKEKKEIKSEKKKENESYNLEENISTSRFESLNFLFNIICTHRRK